MVKDDCIFCKIAGGIIPSRTIFEDDNFRVILDQSPVTNGHALILSKEHADNLFQISDELAAQAFGLAKKMASHMTDKLKCDGFNILQNNGEMAGQTIYHFHIHLIPRYRDDGQSIIMEPQNKSPEELDDVKEKIIR